MSDFRDIFFKQGGFKLVKDLFRAGVFGYAVAQIMLTGKSKKSLEILRLGKDLKIQNKLKKMSRPILKQFDREFSEKEYPKKHCNKVWVFWMQGIDNAPALVQRCYKSLKDNLKNREIVLITSENLCEYVQFPDFILDKFNRGIITYTHLSDLLRIELLTRYGGTWIDSTVFCSGPDIPNYMFDSDFFVFQNLRPGDNGSVLNFSSWFMTASSNNVILLAVRKLLYAYWEKRNSMIDYFLLHHFMMIAADFYQNEWKKMIAFPNSLPHILLLMLFDPYDQEKWNAVTNVCPFHKLTYKRGKNDLEKTGTYYQYLMNAEAK